MTEKRKIDPGDLGANFAMFFYIGLIIFLIGVAIYSGLHGESNDQSSCPAHDSECIEREQYYKNVREQEDDMYQYEYW